MARMRSGFGSLSGAANPRVVYSSTAPVKPKYKDIWYDTTDFSQYYWNDTSWISIGLGAGAISSMITDDVTVINFKTGDPLLTKMAIGVVADKDGLDIPLLVLGAGDGEGNNRGYISKGTDGLQMYYIGNLAGGEVAGLKLTKDGVYSTHKIIVDADLGSEFTIDASHWNAKLEEAAIKTVVENGAKGWNIATANLVNTDVNYWNSGGAQATGAAAVAIITASLNILSDVPTEVTMGDFGIKCTKVGDTSTYAQLTSGGLYIEKGAISIKSDGGDLMMSGAGIIASEIIAGTLTGFQINTDLVDNNRIQFGNAGIVSYNSSNQLHGLQVDSSATDLILKHNGADHFKIYNELNGYTTMYFQTNKVSTASSAGFFPYNSWDFSGAQFANEKQIPYVSATAPTGDDLYENCVWIDIS